MSLCLIVNGGVDAGDHAVGAVALEDDVVVHCCLRFRACSEPPQRARAYGSLKTVLVARVKRKGLVFLRLARRRKTVMRRLNGGEHVAA